MLSSISVLKVKLLAPPSPTLKHASPLCTYGSALTAFPLIQTNQKPYSSAHINGFKLFLQHHLCTYLTPWLNFLIKSPVLVSSWTQISRSVLTSPRCEKPVISISDPFGISGIRLQMTWLFWLLLRWFNPALIIATHCFLTCHVSLSISSSASKILLPGLFSMIGVHPSNRFLLSCTGSLFKPELNLKFALLHIIIIIIQTFVYSDSTMRQYKKL